MRDLKRIDGNECSMNPQVRLAWGAFRQAPRKLRAVSLRINEWLQAFQVRSPRLCARPYGVSRAAGGRIDLKLRGR